MFKLTMKFEGLIRQMDLKVRFNNITDTESSTQGAFESLDSVAYSES